MSTWSMGTIRRARRRGPWIGAGSAALAFLVLLPACGRGGEAGSRPAGPAAAGPRVVAVDAVPAAVETVAVTVSAVGTIEAAEDVEVSARVGGIVKEIRFQEGDPVKAGEVLVLLDGETAELKLREAEARLARLQAGLGRAQAEVERTRVLEENARKTFERKKKLLAEGATTEAVYLDAEAQYQAARAAAAEAAAALEEAKRSVTEGAAAVDTARKHFEDFTVRAPLDGILGERHVGPGDFVPEGLPLVRLVAAEPLKAAFSVPERYRARLRPGQAVTLTVEACPGRTFTGRVFYIAPGLDPDTRTVKVKARMKNEDGLLQPGFFCRISLVLEERPDAVVIPEEAVVPRGERYFVYTVEGEQARRHEVTLGQRLEGRVEIREGLGPGALVITAGQDLVSDGCRVRVRAAGGDAPPAEEGDPPSRKDTGEGR